MSKDKCSRFCRQIYLPVAKRLSDKGDRYKFPYYSLSADKNWAYNTCMKGFCNPTCTGYTKKSQEKQWRQSRKNGFHNSYSANQISRYTKEGALSGCIEHHNIYL